MITITDNVSRPMEHLDLGTQLLLTRWVKEYPYDLETNIGWKCEKTPILHSLGAKDLNVNIT